MRRHWGLLRWWLLAAGVTGCLESTSGPGRFGELKIQAEFAVGEDPPALGVTVDSTIVTVTRATSGEIVIDTAFGPGAETIVHGWIVDLQADQEQLQVDLELRGQGTRLYAGTLDVTVVNGDIATGVINPVPVAYVGPAPVDSVSVAPASSAVNAVGATVQFTAQGFDAAGGTISGLSFTWTSSDPAVATVDPATGLATATGHGSTTITATTSGVSGTATLTVNLTGGVTTVTVLPASATLTTVGATQQFTAEVRDGSGTLLPGVPVSWSGADTLVATIDPVSGLATATGHGSSTITATASGVSGTATLTVSLTGGVTTVTVLPASATLTTVGATQQFTAEVRDGSGTLLPGVPVSWSSADSLVATIDPSTGLATAVGHGNTTITATAAGVSGNASLDVNLTASVASVTVIPGSATLTQSGATQQFTAEVRDANGTLLPGVPVSWMSSDPLVATIDPVTGLATAAGSGLTMITATAGGVSGMAELRVSL